MSDVLPFGKVGNYFLINVTQTNFRFKVLKTKSQHSAVARNVLQQPLTKN